MNNHAVVYTDPRPTLSRWRGYNSPNFFRPITQAQGRPQLLVPSDNPNEINIQGPIVDQLSAERYRWWYETDYFVSDLEFKTALDATTGSLVILNINSPGGTGYVAAAIRSYIQKARETKGKRFEARIPRPRRQRGHPNRLLLRRHRHERRRHLYDPPRLHRLRLLGPRQL